EPAPVAGLPALARATAKAALGVVAPAIVALRGEQAPAGWTDAVARAQEWAAEAGRLGAAVLADSARLTDPASRDVSRLTFTRQPRDPALPWVRFGGAGEVDLPELTTVRLEGANLMLTIERKTFTLSVGHSDWPRGSIGVTFAVRGGWAPSGVFEAEFRMVDTPHVGYLRLDPSSETFDFTWREPTLMGTDLTGYRV
ncbi:MAG: hypothetical protein QM607_11690, partial [Microbacterium sp.]